MSQNLLQEIQSQKQGLIQLVNKAAEFGWIDAQRRADVIKKTESDVLTIGIIGQMKCGKSTFVNSFIFGDDVLPASATPMTANLSVLKYGEEKKLVVEFYTTDEWAEIKLTAARSEEDAGGDYELKNKISAAQYLIANSKGLNVDSLLGTQQEINLDKLIDYVGGNGKYVSITKSVDIYYPNECLKGVEIVDTPGFNDPIVSREERTKSFLKKADVVIMMLYAGQPFSVVDSDILYKNVRQSGIGKVLVCVNKYDIPYGNGDRIEDIIAYIKVQINNASKECNDSIFVELLEQTQPIPLSAEMALLSQMPMTKIHANGTYADAYKRYCHNFGLNSQ